MCGRFVRKSPSEAIVAELGVTEVAAAELPARYNVCPGEPIAAVVAHGSGRRLGTLRWGFGPRRQTNVRSEGVLSIAPFREALARRRCLLPADGFYEWRNDGGVKTPHYFSLASGGLFAFAGIWTRDGADGAAGTALFTCAPNSVVAPVHDRMPVILEPASYARWLDPTAHDAEALRALLRPLPEDALVGHAVSTLVNSARNDSPDCIRRVDAPLRLVDPRVPSP